VALTLHYLHIPISNYIVISLPLALLLLLLGNLIFFVSNDLNTSQSDSYTSVVKLSQKHTNRSHMFILCKLSFLIFLFIITILLIETITDWPMMFIVSVVSIITPLTWSVIYGKKNELIKHFEIFKNHSVPNMNNEVVMFISAGLLAAYSSCNNISYTN
jgi:hypothetical protein